MSDQILELKLFLKWWCSSENENGALSIQK